MAPAGENGSPVTFHHVGLRVADLDRATDWYRTVLEFRLEFSFELPERGVRVNMLVNDAAERVELFQIGDSYEIPSWPDPIVALTHGVGHLAVNVADLERAFAEITAAGARAIWGPAQAPVPDFRFAFLADPDGNLIELIGSAP